MAKYGGEKAPGVSIPDGAHLKKVCRHGQGARACKYLAVGGTAGPLCMRLNKQYLQAHFYRKADQKLFPNDPQGENCSGAPNFIESTDTTKGSALITSTLDEEEVLRGVTFAYPKED